MRISFRNRNLGYPVLFPEPRDYTAGGFDIEPPQAYGNAAGVSLRIAYRLDSAYLTSLVAQGDAELRTLIVGDGTFLREATPPTDQLNPAAHTGPEAMGRHRGNDAVPYGDEADYELCQRRTRPGVWSSGARRVCH